MLYIRNGYDNCVHSLTKENLTAAESDDFAKIR